MSWEFEQLSGPFGFTEGPVWTGHSVLFSDIPNSRILEYDVETGECSEYVTETNNANGLKFGPDGDLYVCEVAGRRIARYDSEGNRSVVVQEYEGNRLNSPNDLAVDDQGSIWFTDPRYEGNAAGLDAADRELDHDSVYRVDPVNGNEWEITRLTNDTTRPNGILVSDDRTQLYVAQSDPREGYPCELRSYPIRDDGTLGDYTVLHDFSPHWGIDGMALDDDGNVVATAGSDESGPGPMLYVFAPSGRVLATHPYPGVQPTNCCFGDEYLQSLYVTGDGCLYRARTDRTGLLGPP